MLCLIGGMDQGLRVGGRCRSKLTLKHGTLLGVLKEGSTSAKVLWDDSDAIIRSAVLQQCTESVYLCPRQSCSCLSECFAHRCIAVRFAYHKAAKACSRCHFPAVEYWKEYAHVLHSAIGTISVLYCRLYGQIFCLN